MRRVIRVLIATVVLLSLYMWGPLALQKLSCNAPYLWAQAEAKSGLIDVSTLTLDDMNHYRVRYRKALFYLMEPAQKRALWRAHFERFSASRRLNSYQEVVIQDAYALLDVSYDRPVDQAQYQAFSNEVIVAFPQKRDRRVFSLLGVEDSAPARASLDWTPVALAQIECDPDHYDEYWCGGGGNSLPLPTCECDASGANQFNIFPDCPYWAIGCTWGAERTCASTWFGCGALWLSSCTGTCYYGSTKG